MSCEDRDDPEPLLQQIAAGLTFAPVPLSVPFRLSALPEGYEVSAVGTSEELSVGDPQPATGLLLAPIGAGENEEGGIFLLLPSDRPEDGGEDQEVLVNGTKAALRAGDGADHVVPARTEGRGLPLHLDRSRPVRGQASGAGRTPAGRRGRVGVVRGGPE